MRQLDHADVARLDSRLLRPGSSQHVIKDIARIVISHGEMQRHACFLQRCYQFGKVLVIPTLSVSQGEIAIDDHRRRPFGLCKQPRHSVA